MLIRSLKKSDLPAILAIEEAVHISPWVKETFDICFHAHCLGLVVELDEKIIGFLVATLNIGECHVLNIAVSNPHQRQGVGQALLLGALTTATQQGAAIVYLEVRKSNTRAIGLYQKLGFQQVGERRDYYPSHEGYEDALIFAKSLV